MNIPPVWVEFRDHLHNEMHLVREKSMILYLLRGCCGEICANLMDIIFLAIVMNLQNAHQRLLGAQFSQNEDDDVEILTRSFYFY